MSFWPKLIGEKTHKMKNEFEVPEDKVVGERWQAVEFDITGYGDEEPVIDFNDFEDPDDLELVFMGERYNFETIVYNDAPWGRLLIRVELPFFLAADNLHGKILYGERSFFEKLKVLCIETFQKFRA